MIDKLIKKKYLAKDLIHNSVLTKSARDVNHLNTQINTNKRMNFNFEYIVGIISCFFYRWSSYITIKNLNTQLWVSKLFESLTNV